MSNNPVAVIIPTINGRQFIEASIKSLLNQKTRCDIIVVDNGSTDGSAGYISQEFPFVKVLTFRKGLGFTGAVNSGIRFSLDKEYKYIALLNNDAVASVDWLSALIARISRNDDTGIVTSKILDKNGTYFDSVGENYSTWGLPFPTARDDKDNGQHEKAKEVFGASGGASLYKAELFREIGTFDNDFFAYYEDVDLSFRAQLAGWRIWYEPKAVVYHDTGTTSKKIKGFTTYQTIKNLPWLLWKNVPTPLLWKIWPRFFIAYSLFIASAFQRKQFWSAIKGLLVASMFFPKKLYQRYKIQSSRNVSVDYIKGMIVHDLPPNASKLRRLRSALMLKF
jgi:GT2 family glycosyltransferase